MLTNYPGHLKAFDYLGLFRYFLTFCTHGRRNHFVDHEHVDGVLEQILRTGADTAFATVTYCFMPDHLHLLVEAQAETSHGLVYIKRAKQLSAYHFKRRFAARLWQRYGYEHVLRGDQDTLSVARYIIENPVRAGLVKRVEDYPFIGSTVYSISEILDAVQLKPPSRKSRD